MYLFGRARKFVRDWRDMQKALNGGIDKESIFDMQPKLLRFKKWKATAPGNISAGLEAGKEVLLHPVKFFGEIGNLYSLSVMSPRQYLYLMHTNLTEIEAAEQLLKEAEEAKFLGEKVVPITGKMIEDRIKLICEKRNLEIIDLNEKPVDWSEVDTSKLSDVGKSMIEIIRNTPGGAIPKLKAFGTAFAANVSEGLHAFNLGYAQARDQARQEVIDSGIDLKELQKMDLENIVDTVKTKFNEERKR